MTTGTTLGRRAALAAVYVERYGLSILYLCLAGIQLHQIWIFNGAQRTEIESAPFAGIARLVVRLQLDAYVGCLLLFGRRVAVPPRNFEDLFIPLAMTFFNLTYHAVPWFPDLFKKSICPVGLQAPFAATGLFLNLMGLLIAIWGAMYLGRSFSVFIEVKKVVLEGAYRWVRHPMYSGYLCLMAGLALANFSVAYFILVPIHMFLLVYRARLEEARLSECSPEYREYRKHTGFLFPKFRRR